MVKHIAAYSLKCALLQHKHHVKGHCAHCVHYVLLIKNIRKLKIGYFFSPIVLIHKHGGYRIKRCLQNKFGNELIFPVFLFSHILSHQYYLPLRVPPQNMGGYECQPILNKNRGDYNGSLQPQIGVSTPGLLNK